MKNETQKKRQNNVASAAHIQSQNVVNEQNRSDEKTVRSGKMALAPILKQRDNKALCKR